MTDGLTDETDDGATDDAGVSSALFRNRARAESFGEVAEEYDRVRPVYPQAMVVDLLAGGGTDVLDVGCGTGKAARLFTAHGAAVLGVEPDPAMAAVARRHGLQVEVSPFESWDAGDRSFDLLVSGQAWHWVEPEAGAVKAREVLRPGGRVALFWNRDSLTPELRAELDVAYGREAPELRDREWQRGVRWDRRGAAEAGLDAAGFVGVASRRYEWRREMAGDDWLALVQTYSDHHLLPEARRRRLIQALREVIDRRGGTVTIDYETHLITARNP